jgi:transposase
MTKLAMDVHLQTSTVAYHDPADGRVRTQRIHTTRAEVGQLLATLPAPWTVALEATRQAPAVCRWLGELGADVHLVDAQKLSALAKLRPAKTDAKDAELMLDALVHGYLPEAYLAPPEVTARRTLSRGHRTLRGIATHLRNLLRSLLIQAGIVCPWHDLCSQAAAAHWDEWLAELTPEARLLAQIARDLLAHVEGGRRVVDAQIVHDLQADALAQLLLPQPGFGPLTTYGLLAELGDLGRFPDPKRLHSYAGLAPTAKDSGERRGPRRLPQRCPRHLRYWAILAAQCAARSHRPSRARTTYWRVRRRGIANTAKVAAAREMLNDVFYAARRRAGQPTNH